MGDKYKESDRNSVNFMHHIWLWRLFKSPLNIITLIGSDKKLFTPSASQSAAGQTYQTAISNKQKKITTKQTGKGNLRLAQKESKKTFLAFSHYKEETRFREEATVQNKCTGGIKGKQQKQRQNEN